MTVPGQTMTPREMIDRLIAFDTTSRNSNMYLIAWVADYLKGWGIESSLSRDADGHKANLFATIGEKGDGGIVLSGHTDVVPVNGASEEDLLTLASMASPGTPIPSRWSRRTAASMAGAPAT